MTSSLRGRLVTASFARELIPSLPGAQTAPSPWRRELERWWQRCDSTLGPASSVRAIADVCVIPLLHLLNHSLRERRDAVAEVSLRVGSDNCPLAAIVVPWASSLDGAWRGSIIHAITSDLRWCLCCNGVAVRVVDARRTWSRDYLEFDCAALSSDDIASDLLWSVLRDEAISAHPPLLDRAVALSARHGTSVCRALGTGVLRALGTLIEALARRGAGRYTPDTLFEHSLTVLYRVLFLLFAEARGLVPLWHPVYRNRYSLDAIVERLLSGKPYRGLWLAVQAITRLAHAGCAAGELTVTAFNGRLFAPSSAAAFDRTRVDDPTMARAVAAVSSIARGARVERIAFRDLDVEQLGAVYEQVLDYQPAAGSGTEPLVRGGDRRKATGTFYTPRAVTGSLVRQTLEPLVSGRTAEEILALRVLDPAMGSGAFLVAACRYLATAAEDALVREGRWHRHDITAEERAELRRTIAARCLFGVDVNPMAVQLARLSLWLATLSARKPLSFLDHHLVAGDSLVGATPDDVRRRSAGWARRGRTERVLPLLEDAHLPATLAAGAQMRAALTREADDTPEIVHSKERRLAALQARESALGRWWRALDVWCAGWFWGEDAPPDRGTFSSLMDALLRGAGALPDHVARPLLDRAESVAHAHRFLHWPLAFPEVFVGGDGSPSGGGGFDAILGNPPWDMVRGDSGDDGARADRRRDARCLTAFVRESGVYRVETRAHTNRYQLFVERALQLARPGGRIGLVVPSSVISDAGSAPLRRYLFERASVDTLTAFDNRDGIFPIHRSVRFLLLTCTAGRPTTAVCCRFGLRHPDDLEQPANAGAPPLVLTRAFITRLSGAEDLGIPELGSHADLRLVERITATIPRLQDATGWNASFGRELNATDDRAAFIPRTGAPSARPIVEGKHVEPFRVALDRSSLELRADAPARVARRARVAYRDVASATNRLTLIAAIIPARAVTTHTLLCLKTALPPDDQHALCALLNSYVANYLVRMRVTTHVTVALVSRLPVPRLQRNTAVYQRVVTLARDLPDSPSPETTDVYAELQALAAHQYGLTTGEFEHVLSTFPLVATSTRSRALDLFVGIAAKRAPHST